MQPTEPTVIGLQFQILGLSAVIDGTLQMLMAKGAIDNDDVIRMLRQLENVVQASLGNQPEVEGSQAILEPIRHMLRNYAARSAGMPKPN